jgi:hypothetical protein
VVEAVADLLAGSELALASKQQSAPALSGAHP